MLKGATNCVQRPPVQRKTAILNKENRLRGLGSPPQDVRAESKTARTKVLGSHQRQNTEGSECNDTESEERQIKPGQLKEQSTRTVGQQPNPVTKQVGVSAGSYTTKEKNNRQVESGEQIADAQRGGGDGGGDGAPLDPFEVSFQEKLQSWECDRQLESMELGEFELLEQAAEELSFSSNSSFVIKVIHSVCLTPSFISNLA